MALQFMDGFEVEGQADQFWTVGGNYPSYSISIDVIHSGVGSLKMVKSDTSANRETNIWKTFENPTDQMTVGFSFRTSRVNDNNKPFFFIGKYGSRQMSLGLVSNKIRACWYNGSIDVSIADSTKTLSADTQYIFEVKLKATSDGTFQLRIDGSEQISTTGNYSVTNNVADYIKFSLMTIDVVDVTYNIDDIYVLNSTAPLNDYLGTVSILGCRVNEIGDVDDFNGTNKVAACRELIGDVTTFISSDITLSKQLFNMDDLPDTTGNIVAVQINPYVSKETQYGGTTKYKVVIRDATDQEYESADKEALFDWQAQNFIFENNPINDSTQDTSTINSLQLGYKVTQLSD